MSAAQRKAVSERMKKYWAARSSQKDQSATGPKTLLGHKGSRKMSAAARRRIGDAQRKRWAKLKAEQAGAASEATSRGKTSRKKK